MDQPGTLSGGSNPPSLVVEGDPGEPSRVALLASSFDPMTVAHAALAEAASYTNDLVLLVTSPATLPKEGLAEPPWLDDRLRLATLRAWCATHPFALPAIGSHGLLVDQTRAAHERFPEAQLAVYCGSDKLIQLLDPRWYEDADATIAELFELAAVYYAQRSGDRSSLAAALDANRRWARRCHRLPLHPALAGISSRETRRRIRAGEPWSALVPVEVASSLTP